MIPYLRRHETMSRPHTLIIETAPWKYDGWIALRDFVIAAKLVSCLIAGVAPARYWPAASRLMARAHLRLRGGISRLFEPAQAHLNRDARSLAQEAIAADCLFNIQAIRESFPGGWQGESRLVGREILDAALQCSRGAVLWYGPFVGTGLLMEKTLARAGYPLTLLGSPSHPFSPTRMGGLFLNAPRVRAENRYLARRVFFVYGKAEPALAVLRQVLLENGVVLIRAIGAGRRTLSFPFLGGAMELAVGAPRLAYATGAALIPVFTLPDQNAGYRVEVGPNLLPLTQLPEDQALHEMASRYVDLLEPIVRAYPAHWEGWFHPATWRPSS